MFKVLFATILGATMLFAWNSFSWIFLPWHQQTINHFDNDGPVSKSITNSLDKSGIYLIPEQKVDKEQNNSTTHTPESHKEHLIFIAYQAADKVKNMQDSMKYAFINNIIISLLIVILLSCTFELSYFARVFFVVMIGMTGALVGHVPNWIWWGFDSSYTLIMIADIIIGWFLAGLIIAALIGRQKEL